MNEEKMLDSTWITNFEEIDKIYDCYYSNDLSYINIHYIYINIDNEIEKVKRDKWLLTKPNHISRDEIIRMLKQHCGSQYRLLSILKYNIDIEPANVKWFISNKNVSDFLTPIKNLDDIHWKQSITLFQDLNDLFILLYRPDQTKNHHNYTKRIFLQHRNGNKKTIKKSLNIEV